MGPHLLLDKSVLQSLSDEETLCLNNYYLVVYAPVQFVDILQYKEKNKIKNIAHKIQPINPCYTMYYRISIAHNLLDRNFPERLPSRIDAKLSGRKELAFAPHPEKEVLRCWKAGEFATATQVLSERLRSSTRSTDLDKLRKDYNFPSVTSLTELKSATLAFCETTDPQQQSANLEFLLDEADLMNIAEPIRSRWSECGKPSLREYAPYAYYCLTVFVAFYTAIANGLIGPRASRVSLEYLLYLPFCQVFCSDDPFHKQFTSLFLGDMRKQQDFVDSPELKQDLNNIYAYWQSVSDAERKAYQEKYAYYPPALSDSITLQLWEKYMPPRTKRKKYREEWEDIYAPYDKHYECSQEEEELVQEIVDIVKEVRRERARAAAADLPSNT
ncbi:hypothetical protein C6501_08150 [Candidatus Poribacteria bacterium]|nr:MAG: hypothetical protein C6501_08150 [Candidatus Poribacteria bacterium]